MSFGRYRVKPAEWAFGLAPVFVTYMLPTMYYDINITLSHNAFISMVVGGRGIGKTYGAKEKVIQNFLGGKGSFMYVRRYQDELDMVVKGLFNDYNRDHKNQVIYDKKLFWINRDMDVDEEGQIVGYPVALSTSHKLKSASFPDVSTILFDEFIIDEQSNIRYLKNEVRKFLDLIETVGRMRDNLRVIMLANSLSVINPYSSFWELYPNGEFTKTKNGLVLLHLVPDNPDFIEAKKSTKFGQLIEGTEYSQMSIHNNFILDSDEFISSKPLSCTYLMTLDYDGKSYGVWRDKTRDYVYIDTKTDPSYPLKYAITLTDHSTDTTLLNGSCYMIEYVLKRFQRGLVGFDSLPTKTAMIKILKLSARIKC